MFRDTLSVAKVKDDNSTSRSKKIIIMLTVTGGYGDCKYWVEKKCSEEMSYM